jgi:putative oxidoreductase
MIAVTAAYTRLASFRGWLDRLADVLDLGIRLYVGKIFFLSGLVKIRDWDATVALFTDEYRVPVLPPALAAVAGTFGELFFPILLVVGFGTRLSALGLTFVNIFAVISYWHVLQDLEPALAQHMYWGVLLLVTLLHGPGRLSLDEIISRRFGS